MSNSNEKKNKAIVLKAFDTLFNKRDYTAAERFWSPNYIQHSAHIEPGRDGLFNLIKAAPLSLRYEPGVILAEDEGVLYHHIIFASAEQHADGRLLVGLRTSRSRASR